jgi:hypothetical protein
MTLQTQLLQLILAQPSSEPPIPTRMQSCVSKAGRYQGCTSFIECMHLQFIKRALNTGAMFDSHWLGGTAATILACLRTTPLLLVASWRLYSSQAIQDVTIAPTDPGSGPGGWVVQPSARQWACICGAVKPKYKLHGQPCACQCSGRIRRSLLAFPCRLGNWAAAAFLYIMFHNCARPEW